MIMRMEKRTISIILGFCFIGIISASKYVDNNNCKSANKALQKSLLSLEKAIDFILRNHHHLIVDTAGSVAMSQGYLIKTIRKLRAFFPLNYNDNILYVRLFQLFNKHRKVMQLCKNSKKRYNLVGSESFFTKPWLYEPDPIRSNLGLVYQPQAFKSSVLREKIGDCIPKVFKRSRCKRGMSKSCWNMLLKTPAEGQYALTAHLALYLIAADMNGCRQSMVNLSGDPSVFRKKQEFFVANLYSQSLSLFHDEQMLRDPFIEHVVFGQLLGGVDFYKLDWLELITSWQSDCGCWKDIDYHHTITPDKCLASFETARNHSNGQLWRTILGVTKIEECCNMHETGLGLTNAAAYIHWLLFPPSYSDLGMRSLFGDNCRIRSSRYGMK